MRLGFRLSVPTLLLLAAASPCWAWGELGHLVVSRAAADALPPEAPAALREAAARLAYLGPEPDRWRVRDLEALDKGAAPDHYLDLEIAEGVDPASPPADRHVFSDVLRASGQDPVKVGFGPYRVVELCQRLEVAVAILSALADEHEREGGLAEEVRQAAESAIYVAGVLGHYVGDLANPHHTTIHYNGWVGDNPHGFATDRGTHARFESRFVERMRDRLEVAVVDPVQADLDYTKAIWGLILDSNALVVPLYELDKKGAFTEGNEESSAAEAGLAFANARLVRGATLLRDLWATACARGLVRGEGETLRRRIVSALDAAGLAGLWVTVDRERHVRLQGRLAVPNAADRVREVLRAFPEASGVTVRVSSPN